MDRDFYSIDEAAELLDLGTSQARCLLGEPDDVRITSAGHSQHLWSKERIAAVLEKHRMAVSIRENNKGTRSCYQCHNRYKEVELTSGFCTECHAKKLVRNFICDGNCVRNVPDMNRLEILKTVISAIENKLRGIEK